eukprot:COSAG01_NODE_5384_length_4294_cov_1.988796_2_plen_101_part_00
MRARAHLSACMVELMRCACLPGLSWPFHRVIDPDTHGTSGYSSMAATPTGLALIFEGGEEPFRPKDVDRWIKVTHVPFFSDDDEAGRRRRPAAASPRQRC